MSMSSIRFHTTRDLCRLEGIGRIGIGVSSVVNKTTPTRTPGHPVNPGATVHEETRTS